MYVALGFLLSVGLTFGQEKKETPKETPKEPTKEVKEELAKLQGKWTLEKIESIGGKQSIPEGAGAVVFDKDKYKFTFSSMTEEGVMTFRPDKKPKEVDIKITEGNDIGKTQFGVYLLDGDTFKLCVAKAGDPVSARPKAIDFKEGSDEITFVFKRAAKKDTK